MNEVLSTHAAHAAAYGAPGGAWSWSGWQGGEATHRPLPSPAPTPTEKACVQPPMEARVAPLMSSTVWEGEHPASSKWLSLAYSVLPPLRAIGAACIGVTIPVTCVRRAHQVR